MIPNEITAERIARIQMIEVMAKDLFKQAKSLRKELTHVDGPASPEGAKKKVNTAGLVAVTNRRVRLKMQQRKTASGN